MVQNLLAVLSLLIGTSGLMLSYAGHRQKVRQDTHENTHRAEEQRRIEQERQRQEQEARAQQEKEARFQRERDRYQASMIGVHIRLSPSTLDDSWVVPQLVIHNGSSQPVRDVRAYYGDEVTNELPLVDTGTHFLPLPPRQLPDASVDQSGPVTVEFTDVAGIRWRREGYGFLQRAGQGVDGQEIWGPPEPAVVEFLQPVRQGRRKGAQPPQQEGPPSVGEGPHGALPPVSAPAERHFGCAGPVVVLVSAMLIVGGIWWLLR
jgi:hypothetical protein